MAARSGPSFEQILGDLKKQIYYPVYFLYGEEPFFIDEISGFIEQHVLNEQEKEFNQTILYGKDVNVPTVISYARRFPMMANYQVLIVKEAQEIDRIEELQSYVDNPLKSTLLVLCYKYGKTDKRKGFYKSLEKNGILFESPRLYENKIPDWIHAWLRDKSCTISQKAAILLTEFLGNDLSKVVNELNKLLINTPPGGEITEEYIEKNIGISKDFNVFELQKALTKKDVLKANQIIRYFGANPKENPLVKVIPLLSAHFSRILTYHYLQDKSKNSVAAALSVNPFFVTDYQLAAKSFPPGKVIRIISLLREYDLKAKGVDNLSATDGELMKELIYKMLH
jgi:DNA polymerase-3 subunit delta